MTQPVPDQPESDILNPEPSGALSVPPPVPQKKPGFLRRLFTSRKKQQAVAIQNGYLEMVDLIRAIRSHLDRQENVQTSLLSMLEKVPEVMESQHEVMTIFKQQLESNMENDRRLTDSMGQLNSTLSGIDETQKSSSRTITDLIHRSRESEQLLREVMRRAERRMTILLVVFFLLVVGLGFYFLHRQNRTVPVAPAVTAVVDVPRAAPASSDDDDAKVQARKEAAVKAEEQKKADELKQQKKEQAAMAEAEVAKEKKQAAELKAENETMKAEKKAQAAAKKKKAKEAKKQAREAKEQAEQEAKAADTAKAAVDSSVTAPAEFALERIQPAVGETEADKPISSP